MKRTHRIISILLTAVLCAGALLTVGCSNTRTADFGSNAQFVRNVIRELNRLEDPTTYFSCSEEQTAMIEDGASFQPYFNIRNVKLETDPDEPDVIHYSCTVPGLVGQAFDMALGKYFIKNDKYCARVSLEGTMRIVTNEAGERTIDISDGEGPFALYVALRYMDTTLWPLLDSSVDLSDGIGDSDELNAALNLLLNFGNTVYADALNEDASTYSDTVVVPELSDYADNLTKIVKNSNEKGYWPVLWGRIAVAAIAGGIVLVVIIAVVYESVDTGIKNAKQRRRTRRLKKLERQYDQAILTGKAKGSISLLDKVCTTAGAGSFAYAADSILLSASEMTIVGECETNPTTSFRGYDSLRSLERKLLGSLNMAIMLARSPQYDKKTAMLLCKNIHTGLKPGANPNDVDTAGWSAAALGRMIALELKPEEIAGNLQQLQAAIDRYNGDIHLLNSQIEEYNLLRIEFSEEDEYRYLLSDKDIMDEKRPERYDRLQILKEELPARQANLSRGLGGYMLDHDDLPFAYLMHILGDSTNRYPRFVRQGVIMGLVDWLVQNQKQPDAAKQLRRIVETRAQMIRSDSQLTFFEVRPPEDCTKEIYAALLSDVLHCANPSVPYCDTQKLMDIALAEVPGVMELLYACPLRLIDPVNRGTQGFYQFKPYAHAMWIQYTPPLNVGKVISRYHEVQDMTQPLSSGLNLRLFTDPYAVVPTLFHEYQHYKEDYNEASVFLKTQLFSQKFYKKYPDAKPKDDFTFVHLQTLLGDPPVAGKVGALNSLIEKYYGKQVDEATAKEQAAQVVGKINLTVELANAQTKWCPEIKFPHLSAEEDAGSAKQIAEIVMRYAQTPRSITAADFKKILANAAE